MLKSIKSVIEENKQLRAATKECVSDLKTMIRRKAQLAPLVKEAKAFIKAATGEEEEVEDDDAPTDDDGADLAAGLDDEDDDDEDASGIDVNAEARQVLAAYRRF